MKTILFVCAGNVFRSMSAELFLKKALQEKNITDINVLSAGTSAKIERPIHFVVKEELDNYKINYSTHVTTKLTQEIIDSADLIIPMDDIIIDKISNIGLDIKNKKIILFNKFCFDCPDRFLDYEDILEETNSKSFAEQYLREAIKKIYDGVQNIVNKKKYR